MDISTYMALEDMANDMGISVSELLRRIILKTTMRNTIDITQ
jgi:hypothetical protein